MESNRQSFFYGYVIVATAFFLEIVTWGLNNSFGVFFKPFIEEFGWLRATIAGAASMSYLVHGFISIFMGGLNDRFGPRLIMTFCGLMLALGYLLMAGVHAVWQLYFFYGIIVGVGQSGTDVVLLSTIARWFHRKRGTMSGIIKMGTGAGMVIMPVFITWIVTTFGWRISFMALSVMLFLIILSLAQVLVRDPAKKGQLPDNEKQATPVRGNGGEGGLSFQEALRTRQLWTICIVYFIVLFCMYTIMLHIVQHAIDLGIPPANAASVLATIGGVSMAGRFIMGGAGDRIGNKAAIMVCFSITFVGLIWLQQARTLWGLYAFAVIHGFAHGGVFALNSPLVAGLFGTRAHGVLFGILICSSTIGGTAGPVLAGYIFDETRSYHFVFLILSVMSIIGLILTASLKPVDIEPRRKSSYQD